MYWVLANERSDEFELSIDSVPPYLEDNDIHFDQGDLIKNECPIIDYPYTKHPKDRMTDNIVAATQAGLLVNEKLRGLFSSLNITNIQFFAARLLESSSGAVEEAYCFANIVGKYSCVDQDESELEYYDDGSIEFIDKLVLNLSEDIDYGHIFRLAEFLPVVVISDALKQALEENDITGVKIYKPEEFEL